MLATCPGIVRTVLLTTALAAASMLAAGRTEAAEPAKHERPIPAATLATMETRGTNAAAPVLMRAFKKEAELEVWKQKVDGRYVLIKTFPICRWSGQLGPKVKEGDRQTPEGFYPVTPKLMNPNSAYYLSFDTGFPNAYDKARGASGSALMVHGTCSSRGCYAMTDEGVAEIFAIAREAFAGGQKAFQFQAFPFRMSARNMALHRLDPNIDFWRQLKDGSDRFEATGEEPVFEVAAGRYAFKPSRNAAREKLAQARLSDEAAKIAALTEDGIAALRTTYSDGGQNPHFAALARNGAALGMISRPEALPLAGREVTLIPARVKKPDAVALALAKLPQPFIARPELEGAIAATPLDQTLRSELRALFAFATPDRTDARSATLTPVMRGGFRIMPAVFVPRLVAIATR